MEGIDWTLVGQLERESAGNRQAGTGAATGRGDRIQQAMLVSGIEWVRRNPYPPASGRAGWGDNHRAGHR